MRFLILFFAASLLVGCATTMKNLTRTQYLSKSFSAETIKAGGLALLPVTAAEGQEGYRRALGDLLNQYLSLAVPDAKSLSWQAAMDSINAANAASEYERLLEGYQKTAMIDKACATKLADALGVRYAMHCSLEEFWDRGSGYLGEEIGRVSSHCIIVDLTQGDVVQEIIGQVTVTQGTSTFRPLYEVYAEKIARSVMMQIPGSTIPAEAKPKKNTTPSDY